MKSIKMHQSGWLRLGALLCAMILLPISAFASGSASITLKYGFAGVNFAIYFAAEKSQDGYVASDTFAGYPISFDISSASDRQTLAMQLMEYTKQDEIAPTELQATDANGEVAFDELMPGIYLVLGESHEQGNLLYSPAPFIVILFDGQNITAEVKSDEEPTQTETPAATPEPTFSPAPTLTPTLNPIPEPTETPMPESTATPTPEPSAAPTPEPVITQAPAPTGTPKATVTPEPGTVTNTGVQDNWPYYLLGCAILLALAGVMIHILRRKDG